MIITTTLLLAALVTAAQLLHGHFLASLSAKCFTEATKLSTTKFVALCVTVIASLWILCAN